MFDENEYYAQTFLEKDLSNEAIEHIEFDSCTFNDCDFLLFIIKH